MKRLSHFRFLALTGIVLLAASLPRPALAQDPDDMQRGVARISLMNGEVSVRRGDSGEWVAGVINAPLLSDDRISTGPNSRAEVQFDAANILRIGGNAEVRLTQLEAARFQMEIARGTVTFRVLRPSTANVEVDTPNISVRPSKQGIYRITVTDAGESEVTARAGEVEVFTPRGSQWITAGQTMMARGTSTDPEFQIENAIPGDDWDRWNDARDRALTESTSYQYVGQGVYGVEDLDNYGTWTNVAPYGEVWRPTVGIGTDWAPYGSGRWVWEDWYGWTWVSYDPWGWAPYHYGRWFNQPGFGWCWYPGGLGFRHYWSPGLVAFFGFGRGAGLGFGFGHIGWVPLAPFEVFHPWWGRGFYGRGFERNFNITNVNITNIYRNARVANGVSGMNAGDFRSGRFNNVSRVSGGQIREAGLVRGQMPIGPTNANLHFSDRAAANIPRTNENTRFFTHQQPNPAQRIPFSQQRSGGQLSSGAPTINRGLSNSASGARDAAPQNGGFRGQQSQPGGQPSGMSRGSQSPSNSGSGGWRRFGEPAGQTGSPQGSARSQSNGLRGSTPNRAFENTRPPSSSSSEAPANRGGWQRFGEPGGGSRQPQAAPSRQYQGNPGYGGGSAPRYSAPSNSRPSYSAPSYSAPRSAPSYSAPSYSAPRGGGGGYSAPRGSGGGGGGYSAPRSSGSGGGGSRGSSGGGSRGHR